jgi:hypothetical protein
VKKRLWFTSVSVTVVALGMIMLVAFFVGRTTNTSTPQGNTQSGVPEPNVKAPNSHYLLTSPCYPNSTYKITKMFLEEAIPYDVNDSIAEANFGFTAPGNCSILAVNGTIRNDYSTKEIIQLSKEGSPYCSVGLDIYFYDSQGKFVSTLNQGNPFRGCTVLILISGEESNFKVAFATPTKDIAYFEIYVSYLDPMPLF